MLLIERTGNPLKTQGLIQTTKNGGLHRGLGHQLLTASGLGQDTPGRRRSAAIPRNELSRGNVAKMWAACDVITCVNVW